MEGTGHSQNEGQGGPKAGLGQVRLDPSRRARPGGPRPRAHLHPPIEHRRSVVKIHHAVAVIAIIAIVAIVVAIAIVVAVTAGRHKQVDRRQRRQRQFVPQVCCLIGRALAAAHFSCIAHHVVVVVVVATGAQNAVHSGQ